MRLYETREHIPRADDKFDIFILGSRAKESFPSETLHAVIYERLEKSRSDMVAWCVPSAWFDHSPTFDFRVKNAFGYIWGLPLLGPTCPK